MTETEVKAPDETGQAYRMLIGEEWREAADGRTFVALDPYSGEGWATVPEAGREDVDAAVEAARVAFREGPWKNMTGFDRAHLMRRFADVIERDAEELAQIETRGNGKLLRETRAQAGQLPRWLRYFAGIADKLEGETIPADRPDLFVYTRHQPLGVVAIITPWNSPMALLMWKLAPALAAGCTVVVKPSPFTPVSTIALAERAAEAGFPPGVFNVITAEAAEVGAALVGHPDVAKVSFTGSTAVGAKVGAAAGANITPVALELGGKSAQLVFADADLGAVRSGLIAGIFAATGQTCVAGSRLLVHESVRDAVLDSLVERTRTIALGDPRDAATEMGPMANEPQLERVMGMIDRARAEGATVAAGGGQPSLGGCFLEPTILTDVGPGMEIFEEEVFGPVLAVATFSDEDEAVRMANSSRYGLAAGVWTENIRRGLRVAGELDAGTVWVNGYRMVAPYAPFGGFKDSGIGRESGWRSALEFTQTKTVWVEIGEPSDRDPFTIG
ncbi:MAG TPA: aldehyde dehydrogenase [Solirubrobacterales bacterium]|jgi:aldehyde dehydrogenase (NAD+)|nr:aldehyde dehydrogenase [Solirubrobacterales bacterium]